MESYHHAQTGEPSILVAFDLREPEGWKSAHDLRAAWGASHSRVHVLDPDHIVLELLAGCSSGFDAKESA